jgi:hypothetical protein
MRLLICLFFFITLLFPPKMDAQNPLPETGISGLYEVMLAVKDADFSIKYFNEYGFRVVDSVAISAAAALKLYGVNSALKTYRMQNGDMDSHGLLRLWVWEKPLGDGLGYVMPETIGQRMAVMKTTDIIRLYDLYMALRDKKEPWLPTEPIADDLFGLNKPEKLSFFQRPVLVRENAVYGAFFTHVFFQRYGYEIPGYGTINPDAPLKTSEFTHHDFFIKAKSMDEINYLSSALGLKAEKEPEIDGDFLQGPKRVFRMPDGYSHWYQGFVSPNNICGKLKFFIPRALKPDASEHQRVGELGMTMHSFHTPKLDMVYGLVKKDSRLTATAIVKNELGERCFNFSDQTGVSWQIIEKMTTKNKPAVKLDFKMTNN